MERHVRLREGGQGSTDIEMLTSLILLKRWVIVAVGAVIVAAFIVGLVYGPREAGHVMAQQAPPAPDPAAGRRTAPGAPTYWRRVYPRVGGGTIL